MMLTKEPAYPGTLRVIFSLPGFCVESIYVVGDFNAWVQGATPLSPCEQGWCVEVDLPVGCAYRYRYLVNGSRWINDWNADSYVPNQFGGDDSVVVTLLPHEMDCVDIYCPYDGQPCPYALRLVRKDATEAEDEVRIVCHRKKHR